MVITVLNNQNFLDIAIMYTGIVENSFDIAVFNEMSLTDQLTPGMSLTVPDDLETDPDTVSYFMRQSLQPAMGVNDSISVPEGKGVGWMKVSKDFKVG